MADLSTYKGLELPKSNERYSIEIVNKNNRIIDSELHKFDLKNESQDELLAAKEARITNNLSGHISDTANPHGVTKEQLNLSNVDNTSDINKPVSTAQQAALDAFYQQSTGYTDQKIADLINGAPSTLDTLGEIADAMEHNADVVEALNDAIGTKANEAEFDSYKKSTDAVLGNTNISTIGNGTLTGAINKLNTDLENVSTDINLANNIKVYVGTDGKLHFVDSAGADTVLNFSNSNIVQGLTSLRATGVSSDSFTAQIGKTYLVAHARIGSNGTYSYIASGASVIWQSGAASSSQYSGTYANLQFWLIRSTGTTVSFNGTGNCLSYIKLD